MTGETRALPHFTERGGRTVVPMHFEPTQSFFVIFREAAKIKTNAAQNFPALKPAVVVEGPGNRTSIRNGAGRKVSFDRLEDWSKRTEVGIKFYSAPQFIGRHLKCPTALSQRHSAVLLDLGNLKNMARVRFNGNDLGILWTDP